MRASKYGNKRTERDGYLFDSRAEADRWSELRLLERAGEIGGLSVHPSWTLLDAFTDLDGKRQRAIVYEGDFLYMEKGQPICEDVKGVASQAFLLKAKLFRARYPGITLRIVPADKRKRRALAAGEGT